MSGKPEQMMSFFFDILYNCETIGWQMVLNVSTVQRARLSTCVQESWQVVYLQNKVLINRNILILSGCFFMNNNHREKNVWSCH